MLCYESDKVLWKPLPPTHIQQFIEQPSKTGIQETYMKSIQIPENVVNDPIPGFM